MSCASGFLLVLTTNTKSHKIWSCLALWQMAWVTWSQLTIIWEKAGGERCAVWPALRQLSVMIFIILRSLVLIIMRVIIRRRCTIEILSVKEGKKWLRFTPLFALCCLLILSRSKTLYPFFFFCLLIALLAVFGFSLFYNINCILPFLLRHIIFSLLNFGQKFLCPCLCFYDYIGLTSIYWGFQGKRAISDHMNEAVNYIKHLQKNIKELSVKRNRLKQFDSSTAGSINSNSDSSSSMIVNQSLVGVEIMFSSGFWAKSLRLSRVLHVILEEGLCVRSCTSARADDKFLHTIQAEVCIRLCACLGFCVWLKLFTTQ